MSDPSARVLRVFLLLLLPALVSCTGGSDPTPALPVPTTVPTIVPSAMPEEWTRCVNRVEGWSIGYPTAWFTTDRYTDPLTGQTERHPETACHFFDPKKFRIVQNSEFPETLLQVGFGHGLERNIGYLTDPTFWRTLAREDALVLGMPATRLEVRSTGDGLVLKGTRYHGWMVDLGKDRWFSVFAVAPPGTTRGRYLAYRDVAERAIATMRFATALPST